MSTRTAERPATGTRTDPVNRQPKTVHYVLRSERLFSEATGLQVKARCGRWFWPRPEVTAAFRAGTLGPEWRVCRTCQRIHDKHQL